MKSLILPQFAISVAKHTFTIGAFLMTSYLSLFLTILKHAPLVCAVWVSSQIITPFMNRLTAFKCFNYVYCVHLKDEVT